MAEFTAKANIVETNKVQTTVLLFIGYLEVAGGSYTTSARPESPLCEHPGVLERRWEFTNGKEPFGLVARARLCRRSSYMPNRPGSDKLWLRRLSFNGLNVTHSAHRLFYLSIGLISPALRAARDGLAQPSFPSNMERLLCL